MMLPLALILALASIPARVTGPPPAAVREVVVAGPGPYRLDLDAEAVAATTDGLRVLRLRTVTDEEVPYLVVPSEPGPEEWIVSRRILPLAETKERSGFEADLGQLATVSAAEIEGLGSPLLKRFRLEGSGDRARWVVLVDDGTLFDLPDEGLRRLRAEFEPGSFRYLRVTWDDRTSARAPRPTSVSARRVVGSPKEIVLRVPVELRRKASEPGVTRLHVALPAKDLPIRAIVLETAQPDVLRPARVTVPAIGTDGLRPQELGSATLRRSVRDGAVAEDLRIPIRGAVPAASLDVVLDDGDNAPLRDLAATIELGPLPWIYFESPGAGPLLASFDEQADAPRYDLEAARARVEASDPPRASWGAWRERATPTPAPGPSPLVQGALLDPAPFQAKRAVPAAPPGLASLLLDADVLASSPDLADVRLLDASGRQIPYLNEERDEPLVLVLPALVPWTPKKDEPPAPAGVTRLALELPRAGLPASRVVLRTPVRVFERRVRVVAVRSPLDPRAGPQREVLAEATWRGLDPDEPAHALTLALPRTDQARLLLEIEEGDNVALALEAPELLLPHRRLRFEHPGGDAVRLLYSNPLAAAPRYDVSLLRAAMLGAPATDLELHAIEPRPPRDAGSGRNKLVLWALLGGTVIVLLLVLGRLVRHGPEGAG